MIAVPLTRGFQAVIDECDAERVALKKWSASGPIGQIRPQHYWRENGRVRGIGLGRYIMGNPTDLVVDHIDHDTLNNTRRNLRVCTEAQNLRNRKMYRNNKTGFKGVFLDGGIKRPFLVRIGFQNESIYVGSFATAEEAALVYDSEARRLHGEFASLNFPATPVEQAA